MGDQTPIYNFYKPDAQEVGWGDKVNASWDEAEAQLVANAEAISDEITARANAVAGAVTAAVAASQNYTDGQLKLLPNKAPVKAVTTTNINLAIPGVTFDTVTFSAPGVDSLLVVAQTDKTQNGIYLWNGASSALTRRPDADSSAEFVAGMFAVVQEGSNANRDKLWMLETNAPIVLGTTELTFALASGPSAIGGVVVSGTPTAGQVPVAQSASAATWATPSSSGVDLAVTDARYVPFGRSVATRPFSLRVPAGVRIKGGNLVPKPSDNGVQDNFWINWDWDGWVKPQIDKLKSIGGNCVRVITSFQGIYAGTLPAATIYARYKQLLDYCQSINLMAYPCFGAWSDVNTPAATQLDHALVAYQPLIALFDTYPNVIGVDIWQERSLFAPPGTDIDASVTFLLAGLRPYTTLALTASTYGFSGFNGSTTLLPNQDFYDHHLYPATTGYIPSAADLSAYVDSVGGVPVLIGEFGVTASLATDVRSRMVAAMGEALTAPVVGGLIWGMSDQSASAANQWGLYDASFNPRIDIITPFTTWPSKPAAIAARLSVTSDAILSAGTAVIPLSISSTSGGITPSDVPIRIPVNQGGSHVITQRYVLANTAGTATTVTLGIALNAAAAANLLPETTVDVSVPANSTTDVTVSTSDVVSLSGRDVLYPLATTSQLGIVMRAGKSRVGIAKVSVPDGQNTSIAPAVPVAPTNVVVNANSTAVTLSWAAPASPGSSVRTYTISRAATPGGTKSVVGTVTGRTLSFLDTTGTPGTGYYYSVTATNLTGTSPSSLEVVGVRTVPPGRPASAPATTAQPTAWYRPEQLATVSSGAAVTSWPDFTSNANNAQNTNTANAPTYIPSSTGGLAALMFTGSSVLFAPVQAAQQDVTVLIVAKQTTAGNADLIRGASAATGTTPPTNADGTHGGTQVTGTLNGKVNAGGNWEVDRAGTQMLATSGAVSLNATTVVALSIDGVANGHQTKATVNGASGVVVTPSPSFSNIGNVFLGIGGYAGDTNGWKGEIQEIIYFSTCLNDADRHAWTAYLGTTYGIAVGAS